MDIRLEASVEKFILSLEKHTIAKVLRHLELLERFGHKLDMPHSKKIGSDYFELRIRGKQEVRIFYVFKKGAALLFHGFVKKSQKTPQREIEQAKRKLKGLT
jgi:phage-related protein